MKSVIDINPADSVVRVIFSEEFDIDYYEEFYKQLVQSEEFQVGMNMIWDIRQLDIRCMTTALVQEIGGISMKYAKYRGRGKTAFVVGTDFQFGTARMFDSYHNGIIPAIFRPFKTMEEAEAWVRGDCDTQFEE